MGATWPFVGREAELELIRSAMADDNGIVLAGPSGAGKTRLGYEAVSGVDERRYLCLWVTATPATRHTTLGVLAPLLPTGLRSGPTGSAVGLLRGVVDALLHRCGPRRLVLAVDDAHLLDEVSAALVLQLARSGQAFVLVCVRSRHPVPDVIRALWKDGLAARVEVEALPPDRMSGLLAAVLGGQVDEVTCRRLSRIAQGNLHFLRELVRAGIAGAVLTELGGVWRWEGPWVSTATLVGLVTERIGRLSREERHVLELVAVGEPVGADVLISLTDRRSVEALESRDLLRARREGRRVDVRLAHLLYAQVLRATCPPERVSELRRSLARAVRATGARRRDDGLRLAAWHLDAGLRVDTSVLLAAAEQALETLDLPLARRLANAAWQDVPDPAAASVLCRALLLSPDSAGSGENADSADIEERLAGLAQRPMTAAQHSDWAITRAANLFWGLQRSEAAFAVLRQTWQRVEDPGCRVRLDLLDCTFQLLAGKPEQAASRLADLARRPEVSPAVGAAVAVLCGVALVHLGRLIQAREQLERAAAGPGSRGMTARYPWLVPVRQLYRGCAALLAGRLGEADELIRDFHQHALDTEWDFSLRLSYIAQAWVGLLRGRVRTAVRCARQARRLLGQHGGGPFHRQVFAALAHAEAVAGNPAAAVAAMAAADRDPTPTEALLQPWIELARSWLAATCGDLAHAVRLALAAADSARQQQAASIEAFALHDVVRLAMACDVAVPGVVSRLRELAATVDSELVCAFAEHAEALAAVDRWRLERCAALFAGLGTDLLAAEAYAQAARGARARGDLAASRRLGAQASRLLAVCEGARTPLLADLEVPQLTAREWEVAALAAEGHSNQQIAERFTISSRTVGNHLHRVYAKLGINSRSELAGLLLPRGRDPDDPAAADGTTGTSRFPKVFLNDC